MHCRLQAIIDAHNSAVADGAPGMRLTQRAVAESTGIAVTTISRLAQDTAMRVDYATIERLCAFLQCELSDLLVLREEHSDDED